MLLSHLKASILTVLPPLMMGCGAGLLCLQAFALDSSGTTPTELVLLPGVAQVSPDYPVQVVAMLRRSDGAWVDCTHDTTSVYRIEQSGESETRQLQIDGQGVLRLLQPNAPSSAQISNAPTARLVVRHGNYESTCPIVISAQQPEPPVFAREIAAILGKSGCNQGACHGNLHGKGGLRLSLRGDDPQLDFRLLISDSGGRRVDTFAPELSLLLRKPTGQSAHQGGTRFDTASQSYHWLKQWIDGGCRWNPALHEPPASPNETPTPDETLVQLTVFPATVLLAENSRSQQLTVQAEFADGTVRDVTRWARYEASVVSGVQVSEVGLVEASRPIDVTCNISYLTGRCASRLTFLPSYKPTQEESLASTPLDRLVDAQLSQMRIAPASVSDDSVFLRRAYLTVAGRLPTASEASEFLASDDRRKRESLAERLLFDPGYSMLWALRWSDLLRNEQKVMSSEGAQLWYAWLAQQMSEDRPLNQMVYDLVATVGSTYENPPASFHRTHREPELAAETIGQVFLGVRLQCARCHNHPFDSWRQDDYYGLAAYFTTVERKQIENAPKDKFDKHIISGDEVISLAARPAKIWHPGLAADVPPKPLTQHAADARLSEVPDAGQATPLQHLAAWLTTDNRLFARNMANRIWYHLMGRGIVDPPDDFRDSNPPSNPALLEYLTDELIRSNYSVRHVSRLILQSRTFARQAHSNITPDSDQLDGEAMFASYPLRRMPAEVLYDAIRDVTAGFRIQEEGKSLAAWERRAIAQAETPTQPGFLATFGKPNRLLVCECERSTDVSLGQSLLLINGAELREELAQSNNRLGRFLDRDVATPELIDELYLTALSRRPTTLEREQMVAYIADSHDRRSACEDVLWALFNSKEFVLIR